MHSVFSGLAEETSSHVESVFPTRTGSTGLRSQHETKEAAKQIVRLAIQPEGGRHSIDAERTLRGERVLTLERVLSRLDLLRVNIDFKTSMGLPLITPSA